MVEKNVSNVSHHSPRCAEPNQECTGVCVCVCVCVCVGGGGGKGGVS